MICVSTNVDCGHLSRAGMQDGWTPFGAPGDLTCFPLGTFPRNVLLG